ncbi:MAG: PAS domain S-box protein [Spirochaetaceae bacterium]
MKKILLVEDEAIIALSEARTIEKHGYAVITAHSGHSAVQTALSDREISLVLMDVDLGREMDGTEAAETILSERDLPVVFLTSHAERRFVERAKWITNYGYVLKNSGEFVLLESIEMAFNLFEAHRTATAEKEKFQALVNQTPDMLFLHDLDGRIVEVNEPAVRYTGYSREELLSMSIPDLDPDYRARENGGRFWDHVERGRPCHFEARIRRKDGSLFPIEIALSKVELADGTYIMTLSREITERKRVEEARDRERLHLSAVFESVEEAIVICDEDGRIVRFNEAARRLHGLPERPVPAEQWAQYYNLFRTDGVTPLPTEEVPLYRALEGEQVKDAPIMVAPEGRQPRLLACTGHPLTDEHGNGVGAMVVMREVGRHYPPTP